AMASLVVPRGTPATLDAACLDYADGVSDTFVDAGGATAVVHFKHDGDSLWVCVEAARGSRTDRTLTLYLDPGAGGGAVPAPDDAALEMRVTDGTRTSRRGDGAPGAYVPRPGLDQLWNGISGVARAGDRAEYRLSLTGLQLGTCGSALGI